jgi:hypothetical protein
LPFTGQTSFTGVEAKVKVQTVKTAARVRKMLFMEVVNGDMDTLLTQCPALLLEKNAPARLLPHHRLVSRRSPGAI